MAIMAQNFFKYIDDFMDYRQNIYEISPQTVKSNLVDLNLFKNFITSQKQKNIGGPAVIDFQYYLKNQRHNCGASINRKIFTLRSYANYLKVFEIRGADTLPFYDVPKIRSGYRKLPHALTPQQIKLLLDQIDTNTILGIRDYAVYALMYQLGLRVGEVHGINLQNIDLKKNMISVIGKGNKPRSLHINSQLCDILCQYLAVRDQFHNSWLTSALFISKKGNRLAIRTIEDNFKKILFYSSISVPFNVTCHTLRHSLASHLNDNDVDILVIQSILGHLSSRSTEPYIHPSFDRIRRAMEKLPGVVFVKELIQKGKLNLSFQKPIAPKRE
jgi:site-specific recombinase XerD